MSSAPPLAAPAPLPPAARERGPGAARLALLLAVPALLVALLSSLLATGGAAPRDLGDPGAAVRWGLPVVLGLRDLSVSVVLGALLLLAVALSPGTPAWARAARVASACAVAWVLASVAALVLSYADVSGRPLTAPGFGGELGFYVAEVEPGRLLGLAVALAVLAATLPAVGTATPTAAAWGAGLTAAALVPLALAGHGSGDGGHRTAVTAWWLHGVGVGAWVGGLVALALVGGLLGPQLSAVARRYSALALGAFVLVVVSGLANGWVQLGSLGALASPYGALLLVKALATAGLGVAGWLHRRRALGALDAGRARSFWRLVAGEVLVMAATTGVAVALARTGPPLPGGAVEAATPAEVATGEPLPPLPLTPARFVTEARPDLLWLLVVAALLAGYLAGVARLRRRGDGWPLGRTLSWVAGCAVLAWVTSVGPTAYAEVLFSAHMVAHMVLTMVVPPLLVVGAPVTLAVRALPRRTDGTRGPREWLLTAVHSRYARFLSHPVVAAVVFAGSLVAFYYTPLFGLALSTHLGHELMQVHFLASGYLFANALVGVDPGPSRPPYPLRLLLLLATMAFHAFFGVALLTSEDLLQATWFSSLGTGVDALADQRTGGGIAWSIGELPTLLLAVVLAAQWARSDTREARRRDRAAGRDDDADLTRYNAMLAGIAQRDREQDHAHHRTPGGPR
ncbi:bifunctional copper resistance protein CopD/cytochrome c oxidase assembly protein [Quadrisphaera sp. DSM 44207]|uniref:bifunctional copper resistance protein CopD/cytochrome c oxidase assembly protein n=1 Tax=Quadrisphaera sp. DSM 44207 TaxID=1881057 RepID=UPI00088D87B5|nr:bifunctional copper resistance protein CopD/cytochrome c oxidase assembly protein [Quadrisphaera sp. DSM 44207]SDQ88742.1 putative copper resistance protein D [Quadrisphaera sp. DSM 44207]